MSGIQRSVFPFGPTITDAYNISTNGTGSFGDNSNNLITNFTPSKDSAQLGVKGNINSVGTYFSNSVTSIRLPADSSANRPPQGLRGYIRYNTDLSQNNIEYYNGFVPAWQQLATAIYFQLLINKAPTIQSFLTTSVNTYFPSSGVLYIKIRMVGGGGGGAGSGTAGPESNSGWNGGSTTGPPITSPPSGAGASGSPTTFSTFFTANGGGYGSPNGTGGAGGGVPSTGGSGSITGGYSGFVITGGQGSGACSAYVTTIQAGGGGGSSAFGGNGGAGGGGATSGTINGGDGTLGGGGGGGGTNLGAAGGGSVPYGALTGAGGGAGGYVEAYFPISASSYPISVGAGSIGGRYGETASTGVILGSGGAGGTGAIIIEEYYH